MNPAFHFQKPQARSSVGLPALRRTSLALMALGVSLSCSAAMAQTTDGSEAQSYLESMGASVPVSQVVDRGGDANPLLNDTVQGVQAEQQLTHQGNVQHQSNVPAPATAAQRGQSAGAQQRTQAPVQRGQNYQGAQAGAVSAQPLPSPKLDLQQEVLNRLAPANPEQLRKIMEEMYLRQGAAQTPARPGAVGRASQYVVDLSPGASPPVVRVARGMGATVSFVDAAGNPWPIVFANNFYAEAAAVTQMAPHVLSVGSNSPHLTGSVGVMLQGLTTPVNFVVTPAQDETDYRVDLHIPGLSPDAPPVPGALSPRPGLATGNLKDFLYGATPEGATRVKIVGAGASHSNARAWQNTNGQLILRTSAHVISPGWYERLPAMDGTSVYALPSSPVVRVSVDGKEESFTIEGLLPLMGSRTAKSATAGTAFQAK